MTSGACNDFHFFQLTMELSSILLLQSSMSFHISVVDGIAVTVKAFFFDNMTSSLMTSSITLTCFQLTNQFLQKLGLKTKQSYLFYHV